MGGSDDGVMWIGQWCGGGDTVSAASVGGGVGGGGSGGGSGDGGGVSGGDVGVLV